MKNYYLKSLDAPVYLSNAVLDDKIKVFLENETNGEIVYEDMSSEINYLPYRAVIERLNKYKIWAGVEVQELLTFASLCEAILNDKTLYCKQEGDKYITTLSLSKRQNLVSLYDVFQRFTCYIEAEEESS